MNSNVCKYNKYMNSNVCKYNKYIRTVMCVNITNI